MNRRKPKDVVITVETYTDWDDEGRPTEGTSKVVVLTPGDYFGVYGIEDHVLKHRIIIEEIR